MNLFPKKVGDAAPTVRQSAVFVAVAGGLTLRLLVIVASGALPFGGPGVWV